MARATRRGLLRIAAGTAGGWLAEAVALGAAPPARATVRWHGVALGATASIVIHDTEPAFGRRVLESAVRRLGALEKVFSLQRHDSALSALNARRRLWPTPPELRAVLGVAGRVWRLTDGRFNPTVQPLWRLYRTHFAQSPWASATAAAGPAPGAVQRALRAVDFDAVQISGRATRLARPDMALTLNGIAQGYITDCLHDLLADAGLRHVLLDTGELRAIGGHTNGRPWRVGVRDPDAPQRLVQHIELRDRALATSAPYGTVFDAAGRFHHLLDPATGRPVRGHASVTVRAATATLADAYSTAFAGMPAKAMAALCRREGLTAWLIDHTGGRQRVGI